MLILRTFQFLGRGLLLTATLAVAALVGFWVLAQFSETELRDRGMPEIGRLVDVEGVGVYVEEQGEADAPPVLLVHGSVGWSGLWRDQAKRLAADGYRAVAFDLAPMGYSDRDPDGGYGRISQAGRITALSRAMEMRPLIVAHSFGAGPALEAVLRNPERYAGLVIVSGAIGLESHMSDRDLPMILRPILFREMAVAATATNPWAIGPLLRMFLHRKDTVTEEQLRILRRPLRLRETTAFVSAWLPTLFVPPQDALSTRSADIAAIEVPVALIWGAEDTVTPPDQGEALAELMPQAPLIVLKEVGHIPQIEDPEGFAAALAQALGGLDIQPADG